jgi:hypothetical protein
LYNLKINSWKLNDGHERDSINFNHGPEAAEKIIGWTAYSVDDAVRVFAFYLGMSFLTQRAERIADS